ncbi:hypothetical protein B0H19DRAFT_1070975 [Mycena capillaripes]|nr:hypothetical protein B0H19DRAFT_1070975 [Mycena capillaripes]
MQFATSQPSVIGMRATATTHHIFLSLPNLARQLCTGRSTSPSLPPPMDYEFAEFTSHSSFSPLESDSHSSGMFSGAQNLTVSGQTLTNITNYTTPVVPSDFRMVPLGDIDLQHEIRFNDSTGVDRKYERQGVRRVYSARLGGQNTTVGIYQRPGAEEVRYILLFYWCILTVPQKWRHDIAKYMSVRARWRRRCVVTEVRMTKVFALESKAERMLERRRIEDGAGAINTAWGHVRDVRFRIPYPAPLTLGGPLSNSALTAMQQIHARCKAADNARGVHTDSAKAKELDTRSSEGVQEWVSPGSVPRDPIPPHLDRSSPAGPDPLRFRLPSLSFHQKRRTRHVHQRQIEWRAGRQGEQACAAPLRNRYGFGVEAEAAQRQVAESWSSLKSHAILETVIDAAIRALGRKNFWNCTACKKQLTAGFGRVIARLEGIVEAEAAVKRNCKRILACRDSGERLEQDVFRQENTTSLIYQ